MSSFTYIVNAYRPRAASALAWNTTMSTAFAAAFLLFARADVPRSGTVGAMPFLTGQTIAVAPLPYVPLYHHLLLSPSATFTISTTFCISTTTITRSSERRGNFNFLFVFPWGFILYYTRHWIRERKIPWGSGTARSRRCPCPKLHLVLREGANFVAEGYTEHRDTGSGGGSQKSRGTMAG